MTVSLTYTDDGGVIFKGSGIMTGQETVSLNEDLYSNLPEGKVLKYQIVDLLDVTEFQISSSEIKILADQDAKAIDLNPDMVIAIVVKGQLEYGMNRMYSSYLEMSTNSESVNLFSTMEEAKNWISERVREGRI